MKRKYKSVLPILCIILLGSYAVHEAAGSSSGVYGYSKSGCGYGCHGSQSSATVISISTASTPIEAGQTYIFRLSVANPAEHAAGCDITVDNSAKLAVGYNSGLQLFRNELTHTEPRFFSGDSAVWMFEYTAPSKAGTSHIYVAGNAVNGDGAADDPDHWNLAVDTLTIVSSGVEPQANPAADIRVFPNPSKTGRVTLVTLGMTGLARMTVSDPAGRIVLGESLTLGDELPIDLSTLPNGTYFLSLQSNKEQSFVKRIVIER